MNKNDSENATGRLEINKTNLFPINVIAINQINEQTPAQNELLFYLNIRVITDAKSITYFTSGNKQQDREQQQETLLSKINNPLQIHPKIMHSSLNQHGDINQMQINLTIPAVNWKITTPFVDLIKKWLFKNVSTEKGNVFKVFDLDQPGVEWIIQNTLSVTFVSSSFAENHTRDHKQTNMFSKFNITPRVVSIASFITGFHSNLLSQQIKIEDLQQPSLQVVRFKANKGTAEMFCFRENSDSEQQKVKICVLKIQKSEVMEVLKS